MPNATGLPTSCSSAPTSTCTSSVNGQVNVRASSARAGAAPLKVASTSSNAFTREILPLQVGVCPLRRLPIFALDAGQVVDAQLLLLAFDLHGLERGGLHHVAHAVHRV